MNFLSIFRFILLFVLWAMPAYEYACRAWFCLRSRNWRFTLPAFGYYGKTLLNLGIIGLSAMRLFLPVSAIFDPIILIVIIFGVLAMLVLSLRERTYDDLIYKPAFWFTGSMETRWSIMSKYINSKTWRWHHQSLATVRIFIYLGMVFLLLFF